MPNIELTLDRIVISTDHLLHSCGTTSEVGYARTDDQRCAQAECAMTGEQTTSELLRLDYGETTDLLRTLTDVRFKLLAFVPTISGAAVGLLGHGRSAAELLAVGAVGLSATLGVVVYELRNTQIYDYAVHRAKELETRLGLVSVSGSGGTGGFFNERPGRDVRIFGLPVGHDRGLALVYGAAIGAWCYLLSWGALRALDVGEPRKIGGVVGVAAGLAVLIEFLRIDGRPNKAGAFAERAPAATADPT
jgi:hypothetical protein